MFICRELAGNQASLVCDKGFELYYLNSAESAGDNIQSTVAYDGWLPVTELVDAADTLAIVEGLSDVCLIVDHYALGFEWEEAVKPCLTTLIVIDDFYDRNHSCDYFINPSVIDFNELTFQNQLPDTCVQLLGPKYALLDTSFSVRDKKMGQSIQPKYIEHIFVSFGGVDLEGWTCRVVKLLSASDFKHYNLDVVVGNSFAELEDLKRLATTRGRVNIHCQIGNVCEVMSRCDLAIGAGGTMSWERLCVGIPSVILGIAENQHGVVNGLIAKGMCVGLAEAHNASDEYVSFMIRYLIDNQSLRQSIHDRGTGYIDGKGLQRVVNSLLETHFIFRDVTMEDAGSVFEWRNHPTVASVSSTGRSVLDLQDHLNWLSMVLADDNKIFVIAEVDGEPVGVCRFDVVDFSATISIYTVPGSKRYGGLIKAASSWFFENFSSIVNIKAKVLAGNKLSQRSFANANYELTSCHYKMDKPTK